MGPRELALYRISFMLFNYMIGYVTVSVSDLAHDPKRLLVPTVSGDGVRASSQGRSEAQDPRAAA